MLCLNDTKLQEFNVLLWINFRNANFFSDCKLFTSEMFNIQNDLQLKCTYVYVKVKSIHAIFLPDICQIRYVNNVGAWNCYCYWRWQNNNLFNKLITLNHTGNSNFICRLDFDNFVIGNPNAFGACDVNTDNYQMTSPAGANPPVICGFNTGQHSKL
jgi:hypothetical protein